MSNDIPLDLQAFVQQEVATGGYQSERDVVVEGLRLLREKRKRLDSLRRDIEAGLEQLDRGEGIEIKNEAELSAFFEDIRRRGRARWEAARAVP